MIGQQLWRETDQLISLSENRKLLSYACECLNEPMPLGGDETEDSDPQISSIRNVAFCLNGSTIVEVGAGRGRILNAFRGFGDERLRSICYHAIEPNEDYRRELEEFAAREGLGSRFGLFSVAESIDPGLKYDLCILANVVHEIPPDELHEFLNLYISAAKEGKIAILEVTELAVGERDSVLFYPEAIEVIFESQGDAFEVDVANHKSHSGTGLFDLLITVRNPSAILSADDIVPGLDKVIGLECKALLRHRQDHNLSSLSFAFRSHNVANAQIFGHLIRGIAGRRTGVHTLADESRCGRNPHRE